MMALQTQLAQWLKSRRYVPRLRLRWQWGSIALMAFFVISLAGLTTVGQSSRTPISLLVRAVEAEQLTLLEAAFEAENPDIDVQLMRGPNATNDVENLYTTSFLLGDSPYDLVYADVIWVAKLAAAGWLIDLSDYAAQVDLTAFLAADIQASTYQDGLYRIPFRSDMGMLYYREDILNQLGLEPPNTFDELIDAAKQAQTETDVKWGFTWQGAQYEGLICDYLEVLAGNGGFWVDPETNEVGLDYPEAVEAVMFLKRTIDEGITPAGVTNYVEEDALRPFKNGDAVFLRNWPYVWAEANKAESQVQGKIQLKPMVHAEGKQPAATLGGWGLGISKTASNPEAAWRVVEYFTSEAAQKQFVMAYAYVPSRRALFTDPDVLAKYPHYRELLQVAEQTVPRPPVGQYAQASDILQRYLSAVITNQMRPLDALKAAAGETRRLLGPELSLDQVADQVAAQVPN
ncbi:MAG: ABC transporter substrate-binding protein [Cyanobacteria bacterium J06639_16]